MYRSLVLFAYAKKQVVSPLRNVIKNDLLVVPVNEKTANLPFQVYRSDFQQLPVYTQYRNARSRKTTIVRKFKGDVETLKRELERLCSSTVTEKAGRLEVKGIHSRAIKNWLEGLGF